MSKIVNSPQIRKGTRFARPLGGGMHHIQFGPHLTDQGDTYQMRVGSGPGGSSIDFGYRNPVHPNGGIGTLTPNRIAGQLVWILTAREAGNLILAKFGGATGVQIQGRDTLYVTFGPLAEVELVWVPASERYEGVSVLVRSYLENLSQSAGSTVVRARW